MIDYKTREDRMGKECDGLCYLTIVALAVGIGIILLEIII